MKSLGKFTLYTPETPATDFARHLCNHDGTDWYDISWNTDRTTKNYYIGTDDTGKVIAVADNGALFFPLNMNVWEVLKTEAPENLLSEGYSAVITDGVYSIDYKAIAELTRSNLLSDAGNTISDWRTELQLEIISDDDKAELIIWMEYIKEVRALDFTDITDGESYSLIEWPAIPSAG
ncbi:hypothetical protein EHW64_13540 [Erwinia psidii]|uniref:tail fiber assembly protein n=1 Tax=Erwinia psidii TaxID=69224 RepID=UPI00226B7770|nr:tail fiber assembly protein [Erwinia psidii]MCX8962125.1 hypothetical protein [Erwinia psidii]